MAKKVNIPTALSRRESNMLQVLAHGRSVVEVGALLGYSTVILGDVADRVVSIDHHQGYELLPNDTWNDYQNNLTRFGVRNRILPIKGDYRLIEDYSQDAHLAFIDLDGTETTTLRALQLCSSPLVAVHDFDRQNCKGVKEAVLKSDYQVLTVVDSLAVLERRS